MSTTLLEKTGYSYSGISDIIHNEPEKTQHLLIELDNAYNAIIEKQAALEAQLAKVKTYKSTLVNCFVHAHLGMELDANKPLVFENAKNVVIVKIVNNKIDYQEFEKSI